MRLVKSKVCNRDPAACKRRTPRKWLPEVPVDGPLAGRLRGSDWRRGEVASLARRREATNRRRERAYLVRWQADPVVLDAL